MILWLVAGAGIGWASFALAGWNARRGMLASILVGAAGGALGGYLLSPVTSGSPVLAGDLDVHALFMAAVAAAACLALANMIERRFGA